MKKFIALIIILPMLLSYCKKTNSDTPDCINNLITNGHFPFFCDTGARVDQYLFQGKLVYVFDPGNCGADMEAQVYDSSCNKIGALGGFTGNNLINNVLFNQNATFQKTIWKN